MYASELVKRLTSLVQDNGDHVVVNEDHFVVDHPWYSDGNIVLRFDESEEE